MNTTRILGGTVHVLPEDLETVFRSDLTALAAWETLTPLSRNEWICWIETAKLIETRQRRLQRAQSELVEGIRRPCCWPGCIHREKNGK